MTHRRVSIYAYAYMSILVSVYRNTRIFWLTDLCMWVEFVVGSRSYSDSFSPSTLVFLPSQKPTFPNSNSTWKQWTNSHSVCATYNSGLFDINIFITRRLKMMMMMMMMMIKILNF